jgi:hypothetical protein
LAATGRSNAAIVEGDGDAAQAGNTGFADGHDEGQRLFSELVGGYGIPEYPSADPARRNHSWKERPARERVPKNLTGVPSVRFEGDRLLLRREQASSGGKRIEEQGGTSLLR